MRLFEFPFRWEAVRWSVAGGTALYLSPLDAGRPVAPFHKEGRFGDTLLAGRLYDRDRVRLRRWADALGVSWPAVRDRDRASQYLGLCAVPLSRALRVASADPGWSDTPGHLCRAARAWAKFHGRRPAALVRGGGSTLAPAGWVPRVGKPRQAERPTQNRGDRQWGGVWVRTAPPGPAERSVAPAALLRGLARDAVSVLPSDGGEILGVAFWDTRIAFEALPAALGRLNRPDLIAVLGASWDRLGAVPDTAAGMTTAWFARLVMTWFGRSPDADEYLEAGF